MKTTKLVARAVTTMLVLSMALLLASCGGSKNKGKVITTNDLNADWIIGEWDLEATVSSVEGSSDTFNTNLLITGSEDDSLVIASGVYIIDESNAAYKIKSLSDVKNMLTEFSATFSADGKIKDGGKLTGGDLNLHINEAKDEITQLVSFKTAYTKNATVSLLLKKQPEPGEAPATDFAYDLLSSGDGIIITRYKGESHWVKIPSTIEGHPVTRIGNTSSWGSFPCFSNGKDDLW